ncbi:hypothetical protein [Pontivivens ytuae]|uniref:Uncharacterized protein n=1 Tax=Pontivivens ytuae TaxID=2789856 RepID=A0A7S9LTJ7_9RHOB|nr:hypothetical protein [Pontivivens ytuae]QPH54745.1 hypothetical protein I0K15_02910 [Pontivivens ytuae]
MSSNNFERGYGGYTFSQEELSYLRDLRDDALVIAASSNVSSIDPENDLKTDQYRLFVNFEADPSVSGLFQVGLVAPIYDEILQMISDGFDPAPGVDPGSFTWITGASDVNRNSNDQGEFIQEFTKIQYQLYGGEGNAVEVAQQASNGIGFNLINDVLSNGTLPDLMGLGIADAGAVASTVFDIDGDGSGNFAPWAGTLLFPFLGITDYYQNWLLPNPNDDTVSGTFTSSGQSDSFVFKEDAGSYDLIAMMYAAQAAAISAFIDPDIEDLISQYFTGQIDRLDIDQSALVDQTNSWFSVFYNLLPNTFKPGNQTVFAPLGMALSPIGSAFVGINSDKESLFDDLTYVRSVNPSTIYHLGKGNDVFRLNDLTSRRASDLLVDGGSGDDTFSYENFISSDRALGINIFFRELDESAFYDFGIFVATGEDTEASEPGELPWGDYLYGFEDLILTEYNDVIQLSDVPQLSSPRISIDAGMQGDPASGAGDLLDLSSISTLQGNELSNEISLIDGYFGFKNFLAKNIESLIATSANDFIEIVGDFRYLDAGAGDDYIYSDWYALNSVIDGGDGYDYYDITGDEFFFHWNVLSLTRDYDFWSGGASELYRDFYWDDDYYLIGGADELVRGVEHFVAEEFSFVLNDPGGTRSLFIGDNFIKVQGLEPLYFSGELIVINNLSHSNDFYNFNETHDISIMDDAGGDDYYVFDGIDDVTGEWTGGISRLTDESGEDRYSLVSGIYSIVDKDGRGDIVVGGLNLNMIETDKSFTEITFLNGKAQVGLGATGQSLQVNIFSGDPSGYEQVGYFSFWGWESGDFGIHMGPDNEPPLERNETFEFGSEAQLDLAASDAIIGFDTIDEFLIEKVDMTHLDFNDGANGLNVFSTLDYVEQPDEMVF